MNYEQGRARVEQALERLTMLSRSPGIPSSLASSVREAVVDLRRHLDTDKLMLAIVGEFNAGKSTFINNIIGSRYISTSDNPCTPVPIYISYADNTARYKIEKSGSRSYLTEEEFDAQATEGTNTNSLVSLHIEIPSQFLKDNNIILVDTPGINSANSSHTDATLSALEHVHACVLLINARKPGAASTIDFIRTASSYLRKCFYCVSKTDQLDASNVKRVIDRLPEVIRKETGQQVENLVALGFSKDEGDSDSRFLGINEFTQMVASFMVNEWANIKLEKILKVFEHTRKELEDSTLLHVNALESEFFNKYGLAPINYVAESQKSLEFAKAYVTDKLNELASVMKRGIAEEMNSAVAPLLEKAEQCMFKTTLALGPAEQIQKKMQESRKHLEQRISPIIADVAAEAQRQYFRGMEKVGSTLEQTGEAVFSKRAKDKKLRITAALPISAVSAFVFCALMFIMLKSMLKADTFSPGILSTMLSAGLFVGMLLLAYCSEYIGKAMIRLREGKFFKPDRILRRAGELSADRSVSMHFSSAFVKNVQTSSAIGLGAGAVAANSGHWMLAGGAILTSFIANEFSGDSLANTKQTLKRETIGTIDLLAQSFHDALLNCESDISNMLSGNISKIEKEYSGYLEQDTEVKMRAYETAKQPLIQTEKLYNEITKMKTLKSPRPMA